MSPILGIIASSFRSAAGPDGAYDALSTVTLSANASSVTFAGIPNTYKHLQIRITGKMDRTSAAFGDYQMSINNNTSAVYPTHTLSGNGSSASAFAQTTGAGLGFWSFGRLAGNTIASLMGVAIIDILDYADTTKNKVVRNLSGVDTNGSGEINFQSGAYLNTSAITSIQFAPGFGSTNFIAPSQFTLYGIK
jgi:hypothetical protein